MDGVKVWYFPSRRLRRLYWSPPMARMLASEIGSFDLVHLHSVFLWPTWAAARAARRRGIPYALSPRGMLVKDLLRARSRYAKTAWIALIERANLAHAAGIHVTSPVERTRRSSDSVSPGRTHFRGAEWSRSTAGASAARRRRSRRMW
jgi:glycosyltransferase involved in cell wall biosynthesis